MERKDIEKSAFDYIDAPCIRNCNKCDDKDKHNCTWAYLKDGFIAGAKWRIDIVWHNSLKDAKPEKQLLVKFTNKLITTFDDVRYLKGIEDMVEEFAYVEDLIPNTED